MEHFLLRYTFKGVTHKGAVIDAIDHDGVPQWGVLVGSERYQLDYISPKEGSAGWDSYSAYGRAINRDQANIYARDTHDAIAFAYRLMGVHDAETLSAAVAGLEWDHSQTLSKIVKLSNKLAASPELVIETNPFAVFDEHIAFKKSFEHRREALENFAERVNFVIEKSLEPWPAPTPEELEVLERHEARVTVERPKDFSNEKLELEKLRVTL